MTPEQRLKRVERILMRIVKSGRRTRSEWQYKINSLIDAQISHEIAWRAESRQTDARMRDLIKSQKQLGEFINNLGSKHNKEIAELRKAHSIHDKEMADLRKSQSETDRSLRAFLDSLRKGGNGNSST